MAQEYWEGLVSDRLETGVAEQALQIKHMPLPDQGDMKGQGASNRARLRDAQGLKGCTHDEAAQHMKQHIHTQCISLPAQPTGKFTHPEGGASVLPKA